MTEEVTNLIAEARNPLRHSGDSHCPACSGSCGAWADERGYDPDPASYGVTPTPTLCGHGDACELPAGHPGWHHFPGPRGVSPKAGA